MRIALLVGLALLVGCQGAGSDRSEPAPTRDIDWGLYRIYWSGRDYVEDMARMVARHPTPPDYVMFYRDLGHLRFPRKAVDAIRSIDATPVVSLELGTWHDERSRQLPRLLSGAFDEDLEAWAAAARSEGGRVLLRFGFEMNGDWFSWNGSPEDFVAAWRHAHEIFRSVGAENVEWVWSPNVVSIPDVPANDMHLYYPGDDVVDRIGLDGYNFGEEHDEWHHWQMFGEVFDTVLDDMVAHYPGKPILIAETGSAPGAPGQKAAWIRDAWRTLGQHPAVDGAIWFDLDKRREGEPNWRIDAEPDALQAFNETFAAPREVAD
jgi:mannan endo-1,4-beta-mannosidase